MNKQEDAHTFVQKHLGKAFELDAKLKALLDESLEVLPSIMILGCFSNATAALAISADMSLETYLLGIVNDYRSNERLMNMKEDK